MSPSRLVLRSLVYHWRSNLAVALGVAAGTAVLCGALLVGDSMRGSLRDLTFDRLGPVDEVVLADRFFRQELAEELDASPELPDRLAAISVILLKGTLENADPDHDARASGVNIIAPEPAFWTRLAAWYPEGMGADKICLSTGLAEALGVGIGDSVVLYLPGQGSVPGDSLLGEKRETVQGMRLTVGHLVSSQNWWLGRFDLRPSQQESFCAYLPLELLQSRLGQPGRVNAIFLGTGAWDRTEPPAGQHQHVVEAFRPKPADYGIRVEQLGSGRESYLNITSDRLLFEPAVERAIDRALNPQTSEVSKTSEVSPSTQVWKVQPVFTYLANTMSLEPHNPPVTEQPDDGRIVPYSTITAADFSEKPPLGPLRTPDGRIIPPLDDKDKSEPQIVLNRWAAESLGIARDAWPRPGQNPPGGPIHVYVSFFEPQSTHGVARERTVRFRLAAVAAREGPAADRHLTPTVPGLTDRRSIEDWNVPFSPFYEKLIRKSDDTYYRQHGLTPKAFVSLATGQRLWGSRFGQVTSFRVVPSQTATIERLTERIGGELTPSDGGFAVLPLKRLGLEASVGATPFSVLFLMFSFFVIAAAVMLVALLFRLGIDRRASELGVLLAVGLRRRKVARLLVAEGLLVATLGSLVGVPLGIGYAALMVTGLQTWWVGAIVTPFLSLHVGWLSLAIGFASGIVVALGAILWAVRATRKVSGRRLLDGQTSEAAALLAARSRWLRVAAWAMLGAAVAVGLSALRLGEEAQAGAFFGAGALVLTGCLLIVWTRLRSGATGAAVAAGRGNLLRVAVRNAARNPGRSTLSAGLVAATCFLIVATSAFRLDPTLQTPSLDSGNGGFALVGQSDQPIFQDLNTPEGRDDLGIKPDESEALEGTTTIALRVKSGDDASCLNLYQPREPRVLGVPGAMIDRGGFAWAGTAAETPEERKNPWLLLGKDLGSTPDKREIVPVVIEQNTALYALHLWGGVGSMYELPDGRGGTIPMKVVGLLANGIFQGDLLIGEDAFLERFPDAGGYRFFLVEAPPQQATGAENALEKALAAYGFTAETTGERLARFLAVQNTYLLTFVSLGGLGLLLGTFGLAAVQMRNVLERRSELALLRATGFRRGVLAWVVTLENALLLVLGLGCGIAAALVAVLPHLFGGRAMIPWGSVAATLAAVLVVGLAAGLFAVRATLRAPLLAALRGE